jgi:hypothetical protein
MADGRACADCGADAGRSYVSGVLLCDRCLDRRVAVRTGLPELPEPPDAETYVGPDGRAHRMRFRLWRAPTGVVAEAEEDDQPPQEGYCADVLGGHDADVGELVDVLRARLAAEIGGLYLQPAEHRDGWELAGDEVAGRLVFDTDTRPYSVVVDGRTLSWEEFGRALESFEGFRFRLVIGDTSDEPESSGADVVALPTADRGILETLGSLLDPDDEEEFLRGWNEAEREALDVLRGALADHVDDSPPQPELASAARRLRDAVTNGEWPVRHVAAAAGWAGRPPGDDRQCCVQTAAALIAMREESGMGDEVDSTMMVFEHADWLGAVIGLVRAGPGTRVRPADLVGHINACPEVDGVLDPEDRLLTESGFDTVLYAWRAAGAVDDDRRLTALGAWCCRARSPGPGTATSTASRTLAADRSQRAEEPSPASKAADVRQPTTDASVGGR